MSVDLAVPLAPIMTDLLEPFTRFIDLVRSAFLVLAVVAAAACTASWAVRARRVRPFGPLARFVRSYVDPLLRPVERMVLRAGGAPSTVPWWGLAIALGLAVLALATIEQVGDMLLRLSLGFEQPRRLPILLVSWLFALLRIALIVRVLSSWLPISPMSRWVRWSYVLTEWMLRPLRQIVPGMGPVDITPIIAYLALWLVQSALGIP